MNRLILFVTAIGVSALAAYAVSISDTGEEEEIAVASVPPQRSSDPAPALIALPQPIKREMPSDFPSLAREIQRELKRVGCYRGEVNGLWTPSTRAAMKAFVDDANAVLPVDKPDQVLLSLLQGERGAACGSSCPAGQQQTQDGACISSTVATNSATVTGSIDRSRDTQSATATPPPAATPPAPVAAPAAPAPVEDGAGAPSDPSPPVETAALDDPAPVTATEAGVVPPPPISTAKPRRTTHYKRNRPPKFVRSFIRTMKRNLAPLGF